MPEANNSSFYRLVEIMKQLRSESGCPWDRAQTAKSLKPYLVEEAYELVEAIDSANSREICEELGDLLLQIVFHAAIAEERGAFAIDDVVESINLKMIRRHPHVFADFSGNDIEALNREWDRIKDEELRRKGTRTSRFHNIPATLPALKFAAKVISRAKRHGLHIPGSSNAPGNAASCLKSLDPTVPIAAGAELEDELGRLLFSIVTLADSHGIDSEEALRRHAVQVRDALDDEMQQG